MSVSLDIEANRRARKWTRREQMGRILWALAQPLFRFSPRPCWGWRRFLLRSFGARIGRETRIDRLAHVEIPWHLDIGECCGIGRGVILYSFGKITLGRSVTVSQYAHLCAGTHDYRDPAMPLLKPPVTVKDEVWICAEAFVGPNVTVGERAIVAACAVVVKDVDPDMIVAGNPAKAVKKRREHRESGNAPK